MVNEFVEKSFAPENKLKPDERIAFIHFSYKGFLDKIGIPEYHQGPYQITNELLNDTVEKYNKITDPSNLFKNSTYISEELYLNSHFMPNKHGEMPKDLHLITEDKFAAAMNENGPIRNALSIIPKHNNYTETLQKPLTARQFIVAAQNKKIREFFPWLETYKPEGEEFLNIFDPDWKNKNEPGRAAKIFSDSLRSAKPSGNGDPDSGPEAEMDLEIEPGSSSANNSKGTYELEEKRRREAEEKLKKEEYKQQRLQRLQQYALELHLRQIDFYKWQPERETPDLKTIFHQIDHDKKQIAERDLEMRKEEFKKNFLNRDYNNIQRKPDKDRDRGFDMER